MRYTDTLLLTFAITAVFDVVLQLAMRGHAPLVHWLVGDSDWYVSLRAYFETHTPLAAALLAGFVGFLAQAIILCFVDVPTSFKQVPTFLLVTFAVSALVGLFMNDASPLSTGLFPIISETYYHDLGVYRAMLTDAYSGLIVNTTLLCILFLYQKANDS